MSCGALRRHETLTVMHCTGHRQAVLRPDMQLAWYDTPSRQTEIQKTSDVDPAIYTMTDCSAVAPPAGVGVSCSIPVLARGTHLESLAHWLSARAPSARAIGHGDGPVLLDVRSTLREPAR